MPTVIGARILSLTAGPPVPAYAEAGGLALRAGRDRTGPDTRRSRDVLVRPPTAPAASPVQALRDTATIHAPTNGMITNQGACGRSCPGTPTRAAPTWGTRDKCVGSSRDHPEVLPGPHRCGGHGEPLPVHGRQGAADVYAGTERQADHARAWSSLVRSSGETGAVVSPCAGRQGESARSGDSRRRREVGLAAAVSGRGDSSPGVSRP